MVLLCAFFLFSADSSTKKEDKTADSSKPLIGHWRMEKMTGNNVGDYIAHMEFFFNADGTFKAIATLRDGATDKKEGRFSVEKDNLNMIVGEKMQTPKFKFSEGYLIISDIQIDSSIWLKKAVEKESKPSEKKEQ